MFSFLSTLKEAVRPPTRHCWSIKVVNMDCYTLVSVIFYVMWLLTFFKLRSGFWICAENQTALDLFCKDFLRYGPIRNVIFSGFMYVFEFLYSTIISVEIWTYGYRQKPYISPSNIGYILEKIVSPITIAVVFFNLVTSGSLSIQSLPDEDVFQSNYFNCLTWEQLRYIIKLVFYSFSVDNRLLRLFVTSTDSCEILQKT